MKNRRRTLGNTKLKSAYDVKAICADYLQPKEAGRAENEEDPYHS